jgi:hypothetical protein
LRPALASGLPFTPSQLLCPSATFLANKSTGTFVSVVSLG